MLEAFELDCFPLKSLKNIAASLPGCPSWRMRGGDHGWDLGIEQAPSRHLEMVPASNCPEVRIGATTLSTRRQSIGLGISLLTGQEIEGEPDSFLCNAPPAADCGRTTQVSRTQSSDRPALTIAPSCD